MSGTTPAESLNDLLEESDESLDKLTTLIVGGNFINGNRGRADGPESD